MPASYKFRLSVLAVLSFMIFGVFAQAQSASKSCPNDAGLQLPSGFCATVFADDIGHARHLVVAPNGVVYVNTWSGAYYGNQPSHEGGFVVALQDKSGTGKADVVERFGETAQTGGAGGTGIGLYKGWLYVEINDRIVRYQLPENGTVPQGSAETIVSGLPLGGDHPMHPFFINDKGEMFVDVATATNSCQAKNRTLHSPGDDPCKELETRGGIWLYDANKTGQTFSPADRYATGIRNGEGFAMDNAGNLYVTQHGRDQLHTNWPEIIKEPTQEATLPAEELMLLKKGGDYGWPECYYDPTVNKLVLAPEYGGDGKKTGVCEDKLAPAAAFAAHWGPDGAAHYDQKEFPARYKNGVFIAFHGSWNRAPYAQGGYNVVFQPLASGKASGNCEIFADGFAGTVKSPDKATYRPTGLAVGSDGAMYVSDDQRGRIYRITYKGGAAAGKTTPCPSAAAPAGPVMVAAAKPPEGTHPDAGAAVPKEATQAQVALGKRVYSGEVGGAGCTGCHGEAGKGSILGPDLSSGKWLWSNGSFAGLMKTIQEGVATPKKFRTPMPAMGGAQLTPAQVKAVTAYVWSLSHKASAAAKAKSVTELSIPGEKIFPESLTSTSDGRVIIGTITARTIFSVKPGASNAEPWIQPDNDQSLGIFGVFADEKASTLWACFSPMPGRSGGTQTPATLKAFDLQSGTLKSSYPLPTDGAFCNDIAVGGDGTAYISDTNNMEVARLSKGASKLEVWAGNGSFGPKGGILDGISVLGNRLFVNTLATSKLFTVPIGSDGKAGAISEVKLNRQPERPDGMRSFGNDLLIIEGGGVGRLSRIKTDGDSGTLTTLKEGYPQGPVAVTVVGTTAYVLEGQLGVLFGPDPTGATQPFHATAVEVGQP